MNKIANMRDTLKRYDDLSQRILKLREAIDVLDRETRCKTLKCLLYVANEKDGIGGSTTQVRTEGDLMDFGIYKQFMMTHLKCELDKAQQEIVEMEGR